MHENNKVAVLGFPCNQFGAQEPGSNSEIQDFASSKYSVNFPIFAKIEVNGDDAAPLYKWLKSEQPDDDGNEAIAWNFTKFLISPDGKVLKRFNPQVSPEDIGEALSEYL